MFKKSLNVYDTWFGFYGDFKKGTFGLSYEHGRAKWVNCHSIVLNIPLNTVIASLNPGDF